jgi:hypothetical protein
MHKKFNLIKANIFDHLENNIRAKNNGVSIIVPHVCNNVNAFGAGFAAGVAKHYPVVKENYHLLGSNFLKNNLGYTQYVKVLSDKEYGHKLIFANMIAQNGLISDKNPRPLNYLALVKCMNSISQYINTNFDNDQRVQIHCPKFGCGLAGGNWNFIQNLIEDIWTRIDTFVYAL